MERVQGTIPQGISLPAVLLTYQQRLSKLMQTASVVLVPKSRRIGITWGIASDAVLTAASNKSAKGMDVFYIGFNLDMTKEFIDTCAEWAKAFSHAADDIEEFIFKEIDKEGNTKEIQAFRIKFDSGYVITALTSRPRSLRGRQGYVIIDEAAFHDDLKELMKAALALLIWGGKVLVISTHDGVSNYFNQLILDARAGRNKYDVMEIDFDQALKEGLYERICLTTGKEYSKKAETEWRQGIIDFYGDGADEELFCIPKLSSGTYLPAQLVESRMEDRPILLYSCTSEFTFLPDHVRERETLDWCNDNLRPLLAALPLDANSFFGEDFGRSGDLSVFWPLIIQPDTKRDTPFIVELRNVPFKQQEQILFYMLDRLPRLSGGAMDARGNGQMLAELTVQKYGEKIHAVMTSPGWYSEALPKYKAALEDSMIVIPRSNDILNDHRIAVMLHGRPQIPDGRTKGADGGKRHGDSLVAAAMAYWASLQDFIEYGYETSKGSDVDQMKPPGEDFRERGMAQSFSNQKGTW